MNGNLQRGLAYLLSLIVGLAATAAMAQQEVIEEIIVTSQKREQRLQDVPIAITAYSGTMLQESGIKDIRELASIAPSLTSSQSQNSTTSSFSIRGIGTSSQNFGLESSVGLYIDGVYRSRQSAVINNLVDIESVEVLRGPQGTLFGKNTPSGAINMRTVNAGHDKDAFLDFRVGDYGLVNIAGASNFSLVPDKLAARLTGFYGQRDGYVDVLGQGVNVLNDRDRLGGRLQLYYTPNDRFDMRIIADYAEIDEVCCAALTRYNNFVGAGGVLGTDSLLAAPPAIGGLGVEVIRADQFDDYIMALNQLPRSTNKDSGLSVEFNYDFDAMTLVSISAYRAFDSTDFIDADFSAANVITDQNLAEQSSFSQELRLQGEIGSTGAWVVGAYYFMQDLDNYSTITALDDANAVLSNDPTLAAAIGGIDFLASFPGSPYPLSAPPFPAATFATDDMRQHHESYAVFGQLDFPLGDNFLITVGGRYTSEDKEMDARFLNSPLGPPPDVVAIVTTLTRIQIWAADPTNPAALDPTNPANVPGILGTLGPTYVPGWGIYTQPSLAPQASRRDTLDDSRTTGTFKLTWFANDDVMMYASYGTGYKSGGTNTDRISPFFSQVFGAETSESIEVGIKTTLADGRMRLNAAVHDTKFNDLQTSAFSGNGFNLQNAGDAHAKGGEIEFNWLATDTTDVTVSYAYNQAEFENFANGTCWVATPFLFGTPDPGQTDPNIPVCNRSGDRVPSNPEHSAYFGIQQEFQAGNTTPFIRAEYVYLSDTMTDGNNDPLKLRDSFGFVHAQIGLRFEDIDGEFAIWGRNLTDERFYETVFDVPIQDGKLNAYPHEPRTWGISYRMNFN